MQLYIIDLKDLKETDAQSWQGCGERDPSKEF